MLLHRFIFINAMVLNLALFASSRDLSECSSKREKPKLSGFLLERTNCIFGVRSRKLGLWNPPILMCGPEEIQLQAFTRNLRPRNERSVQSWSWEPGAKRNRYGYRRGSLQAVRTAPDIGEILDERCFCIKRD